MQPPVWDLQGNQHLCSRSAQVLKFEKPCNLVVSTRHCRWEVLKCPHTFQRARIWWARAGCKVSNCSSQAWRYWSSSWRYVSQPRDSTEPCTPMEAFLQSSRPLPVPPPCCSLFRSVEHGTFPLIVTMFSFPSGFYFFHSVLITYRTLFPL